MEYDSKLYMVAKMAQMMAQRVEEKKEKILGDESNEAALAIGKGCHEFNEAMKENIVEVDSSDIDFSSFKTMSLGGVTGAYIDLSL